MLRLLVLPASPALLAVIIIMTNAFVVVIVVIISTTTAIAADASPGLLSPLLYQASWASGLWLRFVVAHASVAGLRLCGDLS